MQPPHRQPLLGKDPSELLAVAREVGLPSYSAGQMARWLYSRHVRTIEEMTDLPKVARARLAEEYEVGGSEPVKAMRSSDGTIKYLFRTHTGGYVESVFIPDGERATLCLSSQVGCKMHCAFCMTGRQGFAGQLDVTDILNQIHSLPERDKLTNVVFMGQGEPFDNIEPVLASLRVLTANWGYAWSPRRITVSTVGITPGVKRFVEESSCHLAISLHSPFPGQRAELMPAERAFPIEKTLRILREYDFCRRSAARPAQGARQRRLSFEYIMFDGINDSPEHASALLRLLRGLECRVNLIRFHDIPDSPLRKASEESMLRMRDTLTRHGIFTTIRASRGEDIYAACGLLSTAAKQETGQTN